MKDLASLLLRFKILKNPKEDKEKIAKLISEVIGIEIPSEKILIQKDSLSIKLDNYLKAEIFMKKEKIISALKAENLFILDLR